MPAALSLKPSRSKSARSADDGGFDRGYVLWALLALIVALSALVLVQAFQLSRMVRHGFEIQRREREAQFLAAQILAYEVDREAGARGYASTRDAVFLAPLHEADSLLGELTQPLQSDLRRLDIPAALALFDDARSGERRWRDIVEKPLLRDWRSGRGQRLPRRGNVLMARVRRDMTGIENLLAERAPQVERETDVELRRGTQLLFAVALAGVGLLFVGAGLQYRGRLAAERLRDLALRDPLTGLFNRRFLQEVLEVQLAQAARTGRFLSVALFDIDHFKRFNDTFGHETGDFVLRMVAETLQRRGRRGDVACRYGGEEFLIVFPGMSAAAGQQRVDALRNEIKERAITHRGKALPAITVSAGIATYPDCGDTAEALIGAADAALYYAKHSGRDRVALASGTCR